MAENVCSEVAISQVMSNSSVKCFLAPKCGWAPASNFCLGAMAPPAWPSLIAVVMHFCEFNMQTSEIQEQVVGSLCCVRSQI